MRRVSIHVVLSLLINAVLIFSALAEGPAVPAGTATGMPAGAPQQPGLTGMLVPFLAMFAVVYFLMIRPQQKKLKEQQQMLAALKQGDEVVTSSGVLGTIAGITDEWVTLEIASNVKIKILKSQVAHIRKGQAKVS